MVLFTINLFCAWASHKPAMNDQKMQELRELFALCKNIQAERTTIYNLYACIKFHKMYQNLHKFGFLENQ